MIYGQYRKIQRTVHTQPELSVIGVIGRVANKKHAVNPPGTTIIDDGRRMARLSISRYGSGCGCICGSSNCRCRRRRSSGTGRWARRCFLPLRLSTLDFVLLIAWWGDK
jgi:hypothetical protein